MDIPIQITNLTSPVVIRANDILFDVLQILIPVVAASSIAVFTILYSKKSHQRTAMMDVFHMINKDENKETEDLIIKYFREGTLDNHLQDPTFYDKARKVWRVYDQIGLLTHRNLIPKKEFYLLIGLKTVSLYFCLIKEINRRRSTRPRSMIYFSNMAIDCFEFYNKRKIEITNPLKSGPIKRSDLGEKIKL